jgi:hypothetical protein
LTDDAELSSTGAIVAVGAVIEMFIGTILIDETELSSSGNIVLGDTVFLATYSIYHGHLLKLDHLLSHSNHRIVCCRNPSNSQQLVFV